MSTDKKRPFTPEEEEIIREMYPTCTAKEIHACLPHRTVHSIYNKAIALGIEKQPLPLPEFFVEDVPLIEEPQSKYKTCSRCGKTKTIIHFIRDKTNRSGFGSVCKLCRNAGRRNQTRETSPKGQLLEIQVVESGQKRCGLCKKIKPVEQFYRHKHRKDGRNSQCIDCDKARKKQNYTYEKSMMSHIQKLYGLSAEDYLRLLEEQGGLCACCKQPEVARENGRIRRLAIDHSHVTGAIRGLLCQKCNQALGLLHEDPERVTALLTYIQERCLW